MAITAHPVPGFYRHYKGGVYFASEVLLGEADEALYVKYAPIDHFADPSFDNPHTQASRDHLHSVGATAYQRRIDIFSEIIGGDDGEGTQFYRFQRISSEEATGFKDDARQAAIDYGG